MYPHHFRRPSSNEPYSRAVIRTKQVRSGSATLVSMMQTADLRHRDDGANGLNRSKVGRILVQRQVQSAPVVIANIGAERVTQRCFIEDNHVI